jgi:hypothetical protein
VLRKLANQSGPRLEEPVKEVGKIKVSHQRKWHTKVEGNMRVSLAERPTSDERQRVSNVGTYRR